MIEYSPTNPHAGQTLKRPLLHPRTGQALLPEGTVLTELFISKIQRMGMTPDVLQCLEEETPPAPEPEHTPEAPPLHDQAKRLEDKLTDGLQQLVAPSAEGKDSLMRAFGMVEAIIDRMLAMDLNAMPEMRLFGGGELTHPINVLFLAVLIGIKMDRPREQLSHIAHAALLHDIGKRRLDHELTYKPGALDSSERRRMERHVEHGVEMLTSSREEFPRLSAETYLGIRYHHERWDGAGYPRGLREAEIPLVARILAVADTYESMIADQVYRTRRLAGAAYWEIIGQSGKAFDPEVIECFRSVVVPYPVGSMVQLDSGRVAQVIQPGSSQERPIVQLGFGDGALDLARPGSPSISKQFFPRRHPRVPLESSCTLYLPGHAKQYTAKTVNLSVGGACLSLSHALDPGTPVVLTIDGIDGHKISGIVVWCAPAGPNKVQLGIRFSPLPAHIRQPLEQLIGA